MATDFWLPGLMVGDLVGALGKVARRATFNAQHHRLDLVGTCPRCA
ncbi:MAG: hypothetical protein ACT4OV_02950 [Microthrixaceae bacterium]